MIEELKVERRYVCKNTRKVLGTNRKEVKKRLGFGASRFAPMFKTRLIVVEHN